MYPFGDISPRYFNGEFVKPLNLSLKEPLQESNFLTELIEEIRHQLPTQGPIGTFIHHNTLHSFEDENFEAAVEHAGQIYNAQAYLNLNQYRSLLAKGRITQKHVEAELAPYLKDQTKILQGKATRASLREAIFFSGINLEDESVIDWRKCEGLLSLRADLTPQIRDSLIQDTMLWIRTELSTGKSFPVQLENLEISESELTLYLGLKNALTKGKRIGPVEAEKFTAALLWSFANKKSKLVNPPENSTLWHHRDLLLKLTGYDIYEMVSPALIQVSSAFTDQGVSSWSLPNRELGFLAASKTLFSQPNIPCTRWMQKAQAIFSSMDLKASTATTVIENLLAKLGIPTDKYYEFLLNNALSIKGWAGNIALLENRPELVSKRPVAGSLSEFLAVQLVLLTAAIEYVVNISKLPGLDLDSLLQTPVKNYNDKNPLNNISLKASVVFECCQILNISPRQIKHHGVELISEIFSELEKFPTILQQRIWQQSYERSFISSVVSSLKNKDTNMETTKANHERSQIVFCIDEREESIRRHLEEVNSSVETFGSPGFFSLPLAFRGVHDLHHQSLCPGVMKPTILVSEYDLTASAKKRPNAIRRFVGLLNREAQLSRALVRESFISATLGHFALIPFILRVLLPRQAGKIHEVFHNPEVEESAFRITAADNNLSDEQIKNVIVGAVQDIFETTVIAKNPAELIIIMGHGSSSLNNPHESAHDCGACGGNRGAPNARLFARFSNDPEIRQLLRHRGIVIPDSTYVVGAYHDTCDDTVTVFDQEMIPTSHKAIASKLIRDINKATARNAAERARRFLNFPKTLTPENAAIEMLHRAEDFAQPRPEYGHATNAIAFVGRRERTKGLFFDRRAFLSSYDDSTDKDGQILQRLLGAIVPVCTGINLEYYFSYVDPIVYGCGTKLPHNITGYNGVMDGTESDLRTGLPWQMVEIHEPVRLTMVVETTPEKLLEILKRMPKIQALFERRWAWLIAAPPNQNRYWFFSQAGFTELNIEEEPLKISPDSLTYCADQRDHLDFIKIEPSISRRIHI